MKPIIFITQEQYNSLSKTDLAILNNCYRLVINKPLQIKEK